MKLWPSIRDIGLFVGGLLGVGHETLLTHAERPTLLILFAAMMGLPAFLRPQEEDRPNITVQFDPNKAKEDEGREDEKK